MPIPHPVNSEDCSLPSSGGVCGGASNALLWSAVFDAIPDPIAIIDLDYSFVHVNHSMADLLQMEPEALIGRKCYEHIHKSCVAAGDCPHALLLQGGQPRTVERFEPALQRHFIVSATPLKDAAGQLIGSVQVMRDITDRKQAEERTAAEKAWLEALIRAVPNLVIGLDETGHILLFNRYAEELSGYAAAEVAGKEWTGLFIPGERQPEVKTLWNEIVSRNSPLHHQCPLLTQSGQQRWISWNHVLLTENGRFKMVLSIGEEVTEQRQVEEALRQSEKRYRLLADTASEGIWAMDGAHLTTYVNQAMADMLGYATGEMLGKRVEEFLFAEDMDFHHQRMSVRHAGGDEVYERRFRKRSGLPVWTRVSAKVLKDEAGRFNGSFAMFTDITERKRAEEALRESEGRFQALFEQAPLGYQSLDEEGYFIAVNQAWLDTLGYAREEVIGRWFGDFLAPEFISAFRERFLLFKALGKIHSEFQMLHKNGERRTIAFDGRIGYTATGAFKQTHCILQDITLQKQMDDLLRQSEEKYRQIAETAQEGIWAIDRGHHTTYVNPRMAEILGLSIETMIGRATTDFVPAEDLQDFAAKMAAHAGKRVSHYQQRFRHKDGHWIWCLLSVTSILDENGAFQGAIGLFTDITEKKRVEQELETNAHLLKAILDVQAHYIADGDPQPAFDKLLATLVSITQSEYGFLDEVLRDEQGNLYKRSLAISNIPWDEASRLLYEQLRQAGFRFIDLTNLAGAPAVERKVIIANEPVAHPHARGLPSGHPPIQAFMGIPMFYGQELVGVVGVANRPGGYSQAIAQFLEPFTTTCAGIIHAARRDSLVRKTTSALQASAELQGALLNAITEAALLLTVDGKVLAINRVAAQRLHKTREELLGANVYDSLSPPLAAAHKKHVDQVVASRQSLRFVDQMGGMIFDQHLYPVADAGGEITRLAIFAQDVTQQRRNEEDLRESQERLRQIIKQMPYPVEICDPQGTAVMVNHALLEMFGIPSADTLEGHYNVFQDEWVMHQLGLQEEIERVYRGEIVFIPELVLPAERVAPRPGVIPGDSVVHEITMFPVLRANGDVWRVVTIWKNITDRKRAEDALRASVLEKEALLKEIHHRVKNNLQVVNSLLALQGESILDPQASALFLEAQNRVRSMAFIHELLYNARNVARVDFREYLLELTSYLYHAHGVDSDRVRLEIEVQEVALDIEKGIPCGLIINELVVNALKHAFPGGREGHIWVRMRPVDGKIFAEVEDDGIGIPSPINYKTTTTLGLQLVHTLIQQLKGDLSLNRDHGTHLTFNFPL